jgi:hypothetical protein
MSLMRTEYRNLSTGQVRTGPTGRGESLTDIEKFLLPTNRARDSSVLAWGVADGLRVSAAIGQEGVRVSTGTALDARGRLLLLVAGGVAITEPLVDPEDPRNIPTVSVDDLGVWLTTVDAGTGGAGGNCFLTLTFHEAASTGTEANGPVRLHAPWLRLLPATGFTNVGEQVPLAEVTLAADGTVTQLDAGPRRPVGVRAERIELRAPAVTTGSEPSVDQAPVAELRANSDGGLDVALTSTVGGTPPALSVAAGTGRLTLTGGLRLAGPPGGGRIYGLESGADGRWHIVDETGRVDLMVIDASGRVAIGTDTAHRRLQVDGSEVHSGGAGAGYSFADRGAATFVESPTAGERWVWYAASGTARLWSGSDRLAVLPAGLDVSGRLSLNTRETLRGDDAWLRLNQAQAFPNGVHTPDRFSSGSLNVGGVNGWGDPGAGNAWFSGHAVVAGGAALNGVAIGRDGQGIDYPFDYETVGVTTLGMNLRLQSPGWVIVHSGGAERLAVRPDGADLRGLLHIHGREAIRGDDSWLRLNQARQFPSGVHAPGLVAPESLNVGGADGYGNPGLANAVVAGSLDVRGGSVVHGNAVIHGVAEIGGDVRLGASDGTVFIGGNQSGPFMAMHDDLWFGDPQDGTIQMYDASRTKPGRLRGIFLGQSARADKQDIAVLEPSELDELLGDALNTEVVWFRWKGEHPGRAPRLGVIAEQVPPYVAGDEGQSVSLAEYSAMLLGAIQVLAARISRIEGCRYE